MSDVDPARRRVGVLLALRLAGALLLGFGIAKWLRSHGAPNPIAAAILLAGFVLLLALPWWLIRRWRRPK